jgi:hypothetical protein
MTTINQSKIGFFLSGGPSNSDPKKSVGGFPSKFPVIGSLNNLFADLTTVEATNGRKDYRCLYLINESSTDSLYDASVFVSDQDVLGASVVVGVVSSTERQLVAVQGSPAAGNVIFQYGSRQFACQWQSPSSFAASITSGLNFIGVNGTSCSLQQNGNTYSFNISFGGDSDKRNHPLIQVLTNGLSGSSLPTISTRKVAQGGPINSTASTLAVDTMAPDSVVFAATSPANGISLGTLRPGDVVPLWVRRTAPPNTDFVEADYFVLKVIGRPF